MADATGGGPRRQRSIAVLGRLGLTISRNAGGVVAARMRAGVQAGVLVLLLVGCATPDWRSSGQPARTRQDIVAAHPEWPSGIRAAMASGVISAGMNPEMVRAAWGHPTRTASEGNGWHQRHTWHYAGRQHNADLMGGQTGGAQPSAEWTVSFANSGVVGWTEEDAWSQDRPPSPRHRTRGGEPAIRRQFSHKKACEACAAWPA